MAKITKVKYSLSSVLSKRRIYSAGSNWRISHTLLSKRELLLSGTGAVFEGWLEIKIRIITLVLPTKLPERKGNSAGLWVHHNKSSPLTNSNCHPSQDTPDQDCKNGHALQRFCKDSGGWLASLMPLYKWGKAQGSWFRAQVNPQLLPLLFFCRILDKSCYGVCVSHQEMVLTSGRCKTEK